MRADWLVSRSGVELFADTAEHVALVLRVLRIDEDVWWHVVQGFAARYDSRRWGLDRRLQALREAFLAAAPPTPIPLRSQPQRCYVCRDVSVVPRYARSAPAESRGNTPDSFLYGRCRSCSHGVLLKGRAPDDVYRNAAYFAEQTALGVGYSGYEQEREYREEKGLQLLGAVTRRAGYRPGRMLEIGSGFGFTRRAAERLGAQTMGVDLNPFAAASARRLYQMDTFVGTLREGLEAGAVKPSGWDLVLYNFVLEHVPEPGEELRVAAEALHPDGLLVVVVPSMDALEVDVLEGAYRSFRNDHLHIFSLRSIAELAEQVGLRVIHLETSCNAHLLKGFLSEEELLQTYANRRGPDMTVLLMKGKSDEIPVPGSFPPE